MSWAQRLKRVFAIDIECCPDCGGKLRAIACIDRIAVGPNAGRKALTLYTVPPHEDEPAPGLVASIGGFSARRHGMRALAKKPAGEAVPLHHSTTDRYETLVGRWPGQGGLSLQAAVSGRIDPRRTGAAGFYVQDERYAASAWMRRSGHRQTGGPRAQTAAEPDAVPRHLCARFQAPAQGCVRIAAGNSG